MNNNGYRAFLYENANNYDLISSYVSGGYIHLTILNIPTNRKVSSEFYIKFTQDAKLRSFFKSILMVLEANHTVGVVTLQNKSKYEFDNYPDRLEFLANDSKVVLPTNGDPKVYKQLKNKISAAIKYILAEMGESKVEY